MTDIEIDRRRVEIVGALKSLGFSVTAVVVLIPIGYVTMSSADGETVSVFDDGRIQFNHTIAEDVADPSKINRHLKVLRRRFTSLSDTFRDAVTHVRGFRGWMAIPMTARFSEGDAYGELSYIGSMFTSRMIVEDDRRSISSVDCDEQTFSDALTTEIKKMKAFMSHKSDWLDTIEAADPRAVERVHNALHEFARRYPVVININRT